MGCVIAVNKKPLVSYVLTAYNIEKFIKESIECAFAQTYEPLEIVLSDDCSSDNTFEIMKKMAEEYNGPHRVVLNRNLNNLGITQHMNKAYLELANGEIIIAAHGDDLSIPERTEISVNFLLDHPDVTALSGSMIVIDSEGRVLEDASKNTCVSQVTYYDIQKPEKGIPNIPAPSRAFYRRAMEFFGPLLDDCPTEDELITFRSMLLGGSNAFIPEVLVTYRKHPGASSNPENFSKFPLEKIREQQIRDMDICVSKGMLSDNMKARIEKVTLEGMLKRKLYRKFFASHALKDLWSLINCPYVTYRGKLSYMKQFILWKVGK